MYDIDHFKLVNVEYGHEVGDEILIGLSKLVKENIRENDMLVRWGGEEYIILLPHITQEKAYEVAEKLSVSIKNHTFKNALNITCSFGVACYLKGETYDQWFHLVDSALLNAKRLGRNRVDHQ